ncbi:DNA topoisomerase I [Candidatus Pacearchaeota archaeon]|nr:DNA topoisomerase I [Candidatus Pacearchaeota archaeon]
MPKKPKKSREETSAEEYFPVDEEDLKKTTEKTVKEYQPDNKRVTEKKARAEEPVEKVEKKGNKKTKSRNKSSKSKRRTKKSSKRTVTKTKKYIPPKIDLKDKGFELLITEKPQAAGKIAHALGKPTRRAYQKVPYYEIDRDGKKIVVVSAVGHLLTLSQNVKGSDFPIFDISWKPNFQVRKRDYTKRYYNTILKLAKKAGSLTVATDFDVEGEVIGLNVVRFICGQEDAKRMKFSTLTDKELQQSYDEKLPSISWGQAIAGETRHYLDWYYGINLSRALMNAIKTTGKFKIMSIGRVQGPALNLIVEKEKEIQNFKPEPFWQIFIKIKDPENKDKKQIELKHPKDIFDKKELDKFKNLVGKDAKAKTKKSKQYRAPKPPFNLTSLQKEAYRFYGITPSKTLKIAQSLYLAGLISYPRTSSQKIPESIDYKTIRDKLAKKFKVSRLMKKQKPKQGKKSDPAHPAIYPTGNTQVLPDQDEKIYNLIVKRFLSLFCESAIIDRKKVTVIVDDNKDLKFRAKGKQTVRKAWMEIYPTKSKEQNIPDFDGQVEITDERIDEKETQPPKRYSPASILSQLEKRNLGTKATRANILETLYDRNYIKDRSIKATPLGMSLIATLEKHSPIIIEEELTREFEEDMEKIEEAKKGNFQKQEDKILEKAKKAIKEISKDFKKDQEEIGKELLKAIEEYRKQQRVENRIMQCPKCKKGHLAITYSKKNKKHFIACDAYPDCKTTYSLPPYGKIKKTDKNCEDCGFRLLMSLRKGKRPWIFCFNSECPKNKKRIEEYRKRKAEQQENKKQSKKKKDKKKEENKSESKESNNSEEK